MRVIVCKDYQELSLKAAEFIKAQMLLKPNSVLGLPTGSTPIGMYKEATQMGLDFSEVTTFNLDEYYPIKKSDPNSYQYFMNENLYSKVNLKEENIFIPNGEAKDPEMECQAYEAALEKIGGVDLQILGIGKNGHIGFNEPAEELEAYTHVTGLTEDTIEANARFFNSIEEVPTNAITMGVSTIMKAKKILLLASGKEKVAVIEQLLRNKVTTNVPATVLCMHPDVTIICDFKV